MLTLFIILFAVLAALLGAVAFVVILAVKILLVEHSIKHIPGPPRKSFFLGNISDLSGIVEGTSTFGGIFLKLHATYGPVVALRNLHVPMASLMDPKAVKDALLNPELLKPKIQYEVFVHLFGERFAGHGLVSETNHERWARHRRAFNPAFHRQYLMELMDTFIDSANRLTKFVSAKADGKIEISMRDPIKKVTIDVIAKTGFSMEQDLIYADSKFNDAIETCFESALRSAMELSLRFNPTSSARAYRKRAIDALRFLRKTGETLIRQRLADLEAGKPLPKDILSCIIKSAMVEESIQLDEMVDEFMIFFAAGQETTGNLLTFTLIMLGQHPDVKEKLQREVDSVVGDRELLFEDLAKLEYMSLVLKETLRLFPPVSGTSRISSKPFQCGDYTIPPNVVMQFSMFVMSRQEQYFKDPLTFDPERFTRDEDKPLYTYFPFSLGPRNCIGQNFAMIEAKVVLTKLMQNLNMDFVPGQKIGFRDKLTLTPTNDCLHYITPRKGAQE